MSRIPFVIAALGSMILGTGAASGQDYPNKPVRILTSAVGSGSDHTTRIIAQGISGPLGQQVLVDNRGSLLAAEAVSKAPPDGYTLLVAGGVFWILPLLRKTSYDVTDVSPISLIDKSVNVVVVHPSVPVKSVKELIALAKAKPGTLNFSAGSLGGAPHLYGELFKAMAGVKIEIVHYKADAQETADLLGGHVQGTIGGAVGLLGPVKAGKLRALAVTSLERTPLVPGLPTVSESGVPGYEAISITSIFAPAKTPVAIINRLNQEVGRFLARTDVKETFFNVGIAVAGSSPEEHMATMKSDIAKWGKVIKDAGIKVD